MAVMNVIHYSFIFGVAALVIWYGYEFYKDFTGEQGSVWAKLLAAGKGSATILWSRFLALFGGAMALVSEGSTWVGAPGVADSIQQYVKPEYIPVFLLVIAIINEIARRRTLSTS